MGKALYRKYRPTTLDAVVGQDSVTKPLKEAIKTGNFSHAYIFTGPRGCGKTSVARIFAHEINGFKYEIEDSYVDIIEIDGASNNGVDNIRDLREKAMIAPTEGKYKVYIIDEVHMLTKPAFNALLKVLEEPPKHVVFILATTNPEKVPVTITSRSQIYHFSLADAKTMKTHLEKIADAEKINIASDALDIVVKRGGGSFRDSISLLDQVSNLSDGKNEISAEMVEKALGLPSEEIIKNLLVSFEENNSSKTTDLLKDLLNSGATAETVAENIIEKITENPTPKTLNLISKLFDVSYPFADAKLLTAFLGLELQPQPQNLATPVASVVRPTVTSNHVAQPTLAPVPKKPEYIQKREAENAKYSDFREKLAKKVELSKKMEVKPEDKKEEVASETLSLENSVVQDGKLNIRAFLANVKTQNLQVASRLEKSFYRISDKTLEIFTEKRVDFSILNGERNLAVIKRTAPGYTVKIELVDDGEVPTDAISFANGEKVNPKTEEEIKKISDIMGKGTTVDSFDPF